MKGFIFLTISIFTVLVNFSANCYGINNNSVIETTIVAQSGGILITYNNTANGINYYEVIAKIATNLLPEAAYGLCLVAVKNPGVCRAVYIVSKTLIEMTVQKDPNTGTTDGFKWTANKGNILSKATVETMDNKTAWAIYATFQEYRKRKCIEWDEVHSDFANKNDALIINFTDTLINFQLSADRNNWAHYQLKSGEYDAYYFKDKNYKLLDSWYFRIFTKDKPLIYTIYANTRYSIKWNSKTKMWDIYKN